MKYKPQSGTVVEIRGRKYFYVESEKEEFEAELEDSEHLQGENEFLFFLNLSGYEVTNEIDGYYFNPHDCCLNPSIVLDVSHGNYFIIITVAQVTSCGMFDYGLSEHGPISGGSKGVWYNNPIARYFRTTDDAIIHAIEKIDSRVRWPIKITRELEKLRIALLPSLRTTIRQGIQLQLALF